MWDDAGAEKEFRAAPHFRSFNRLLGERERLWLEEQDWRRGSLESAEGWAADLRSRRQKQESEELTLQGEDDCLRRELAALESPEVQQALLQDADEAAQVAQEEAHLAETEATETEGAKKLAEAHLEQVQAQAEETAAALTAAKQVAAVEAEKSERAREDLKARCLELEARARLDLDEWRRLKLDERRLELLQEQVRSRLVDEKDGRERLRAEVRRLQAELCRLDAQLDVDAGQAFVEPLEH
jgi:hypothetical protein